MHWVKEKSHLFSEPLIIPPLRETVNEVLHCTVTLQEKAEMLKKHFFSEKLQADLSDMEEAVYSPEVKPLSQISAEDIQDLMARQQALSAPRIDDIPNTFL